MTPESAHNWPRKKKSDRRRLPVAYTGKEEERKSSRSIARRRIWYNLNLDAMIMKHRTLEDFVMKEGY